MMMDDRQKAINLGALGVRGVILCELTLGCFGEEEEGEEEEERYPNDLSHPCCRQSQWRQRQRRKQRPNVRTTDYEKNCEW